MLYLGIDQQARQITISLCDDSGDVLQARQVSTRPDKIHEFFTKLTRERLRDGESFIAVVEVCGFNDWLIRLLRDYRCHKVILIQPEERKRCKTDRRDAGKLAQSLRSGDLTAVWVPDEEQEAMRDLTRARDDMKGQERKARQQLNAYVLRHGHTWPSNRSRWTKTHYNWLESLKFPHDWQQVVLQEYIDAVKAASQRVADITAQMERVLPQWSLAPVVARYSMHRKLLSGGVLCGSPCECGGFCHPHV